jgi:hypothetical protein
MVCALRFNLSRPPTPNRADISCVALSTSASSTASDKIKFVWDGHKSKTTGSDHRLTDNRHYNIVWVVMRYNWASRQHHIGPPHLV